MLRRLAGALPVLLLAGACGSGTDTGLRSVRDSAEPPFMFFEVPANWSVFRSAELTGVTDTPFVATAGDVSLPVESRVVFQGAAADSGVPGTNTSNSPFPVGAASVRTISAAQRDLMSRYLLAELVLPYHGQPIAQEQIKEDVDLGDGFEGVQVLVVYNDAVTDTDAAALLISVTDPAVTRLYSIAVGCSLACFNEHADTIFAVVDSWLVNTR